MIHQEATTLLIYLTLCLTHFLYFYCIYSDEDLDREAMLDLTKQGNLC